jgi:hypothetical protein
MHSVNKVNFAIMYWFEMGFAPRFTSLQSQLKYLYCGDDIAQYENFLIKPAGQIDRSLICDDPSIIEHIIASLSVKEMSQQALVRKLCALSPHHRTRKAVFEVDKLVRSIYTLRYMLDPQLQRDVHRSQNRIEAYHQLCSFIAQVGGKNHLIGKTDLDVAISNECGRLLANVVTAFNSMLLSQLLERYQRDSNQKALDMLKRSRPSRGSTSIFSGTTRFATRIPSILPRCLLVSTSYNRSAWSCAVDSGLLVTCGHPGFLPTHWDGPKIGLNEPCPCGSRRKYKHCCSAQVLTLH